MTGQQAPAPARRRGRCSVALIAALALAPCAFTCADVGGNAVVLTVTDVNGNVSTAPATVTVEDNVAPVEIGRASRRERV